MLIQNSLRPISIAIGLSLMATIFYLSVLTPYLGFAPKIPHLDKVYHFSAYFSLMLWWAQVYTGRSRLRMLWLVIAFGIFIEFVQPFTGRSFEVADMFANSFGAFTAWWLANRGWDFLYPRLQ